MSRFKEEAAELAKQFIACWDQDRDFEKVVEILEDYITDMDTLYLDKLELERAKVSS